MSGILHIIIGIGLVALVAVMALGIVSLVKGGEFNKKYGNKLMQARVILQTLIILTLLFAFYTSQS